MSTTKARALYTASIYSIMLVFALGNSTQGVMLSYFINQYHLRSSMQGIISFMLSLGMLLALTFSVLLIGRVKKPALLLTALGMIALMLLGISFAPPLALLVAMYLVLGLAFGFTDTGTSSSIAELHAGKRAALFMGLLHATYGTGSTLAPLFMQWLLTRGMPWNRVYLVISLIGIAVFAVFLSLYRVSSQKLGESARPVRRLSMHDMRLYLKSRRDVRQMLSLFCYSVFLAAITVWVNRYVSVGLGSEKLGPLALSLFWLGITLSRLIVPWLRLPPLTYVRYGCILTALIVLGGVACHNAWVMCLCTALAGTVAGAVITMQLHVACTWHPDNTMLSTTLLLLCLSAGSMAAPPLIGAITDSVGLYGSMLMAAAGALACAFVSPGRE